MTLHVGARGTTLLLELDRPDARNAIDRPTAEGIANAVKEAARNPAMRAVVLAGRGPIFAAGGDLKALAKLPMSRQGAESVLALGTLLETLETSPLPAIAALTGDAFGGGCELLLLCDLIVAEPHARMRFVHGKMGLVPAWGGATRLTERVGAARAARLLLGGD